MSLKSKKSSWLDNEPFNSFILDSIEKGESNTAIATSISAIYHRTTTEASIRRFRKRLGLGEETAYTAPLSSHRVSILNVAPNLDDPNGMLQSRGLDPNEWSIEGVTLNERDDRENYATLRLKRRPEIEIRPARSEGWQAPPRYPKPDTETKLIVVCGDQQAPFHDKHLHELFCSWLEVNQPDGGVSLGDAVDFPNISRHKLDPENTAIVNECIDSGYNLYRDYRTASLNTEWYFMPGNHDERLRNIVIDRVPELHGLRRANTELERGQPVHAFPYLLRFDELGINYLDPEGPYDLAQFKLTDKLSVRHGWKVRTGSGATALSTLEHLGYSVIVGHTHRQSIVYHTKHDINGEPSVLTAAEAGCMCRVNQSQTEGRKWPNYNVAPNWQQGFLTVSIHPNGYFRIDCATYVNKKLLWRDQQY